jgi:hypothetical protein
MDQCRRVHLVHELNIERSVSVENQSWCAVRSQYTENVGCLSIHVDRSLDDAQLDRAAAASLCFQWRFLGGGGSAFQNCSRSERRSARKHVGQKFTALHLRACLCFGVSRVGYLGMNKSTRH